jgi:hypothetical protein
LRYYCLLAAPIKKAGFDKSKACKKDRASNKVRRVNRAATIDKVGAIKDRTDYSREKI